MLLCAVVRLVKNNSQYKLTIPIDIVRDKRWKEGTEFRFLEDKDGNITLKAISERGDKHA